MNQEQVGIEGLTTPPRNRRRWFQWSLRGLMLLCVFVAIGMAWYKHQAKFERQREIAKELRKKFWIVHGLDDHKTTIVNSRQIAMDNDPNFSIDSIQFYNATDEKSVQVGSSAFEELRKYLPELTELKSLTLNNLETCRQDDFEVLAHLPMLRQLGLAQAKINDAMLVPLAKCRQLEFLDLSYAEISNAALKSVGQIESLEWLILSGTEISDEGLRHLANLKKLQRLNLDNTRVTGSGLSFLQGCASLQSLDLSNTSLDNESLIALGRLTSLWELNLQKSRINDQGLRHLVGLHSLRELYLNDTAIHDAGVAALKNLPALRFINLDKTQITDDSLRQLQSFPGLKTVRLNDQITPAAIERFHSVPGHDINILNDTDGQQAESDPTP